MELSSNPYSENDQVNIEDGGDWDDKHKHKKHYEIKIKHHRRKLLENITKRQVNYRNAQDPALREQLK